MPHPPSEGGNQIRAVAREVTARGLFTDDLRRVRTLLHIAFAGEDDEAALDKRVRDLVLAQTDDTPSSFVRCCEQFADMVDEVAARWEKDLT